MLHIWMGFHVVNFLLSIVDIVVLFFVWVNLVIFRCVILYHHQEDWLQ